MSHCAFPDYEIDGYCCCSSDYSVTYIVHIGNSQDLPEAPLVEAEPTALDSLPKHVKNAPSLEAFRLRLKINLLKLSYDFH